MNYSIKHWSHALGLCALLFMSGLCSAATATSRVAGASAQRPKKLLVVTVTKGFRHKSIPTTESVIQQLSVESRRFTVDFARTDEELAARTTPTALKGYDGVIFANTTGDLPVADRRAFIDWISAGHALIGIHAATDTFHGYPEFIKLIGGEFDSHGPQVEVEAIVEDTSHPATIHLGATHKVFDEIYIFKSFTRANVHMLLGLNKHPNTGAPGYYPLAWTRTHGRGRVFYTAFGHREDVLEADWYKRHLLGGIQWALGDAKAGAKPKRTTRR